MPLSDLAHSLPAAVLVGLIPGFALASLLMPRWPAWWRLAAAPGLSAGMAGVVGLIFHHLHLGFKPLTVLPVDAAVVLGVVVARRRLRGAAPGGPHNDGWVVAAAIAAGLVTSISVIAGYHDQALPVETDAPVHATVARAIADTADVEPVIPQPIDGTGFVRPRMGVEAEVALITQLGGPGAAESLLPLTLLAVLLAPLGVALLCMATAGSRVVAGLAALLTVGWAFPSHGLTFGEYPYVVDATLVVPLVVAGLYAVRGWDARRAVALAAAAVAAIWVVHGLEALTALCVGGPVLAAAVYHGGRPALRRAVALGGCLAIAALVVTVLSRAPQVPAPVVSPLQGPVVSETSVFGATIPYLGLGDGMAYVRQFGFAGNAAIALALAGGVCAVITRRLRWALVSSLLVIAITLDVVSGAHLKRLWLDVYPWSSGDRVIAILFWTLTPLMAFGMVTVWRALAARAGSAVDVREVRRRRVLAVALASAAVAVTGVAGVIRDLDIYRTASGSFGVVTADDLRVLAATDGALPPGVTVLTDGLDDSGQWLDAFAPGRSLLTKVYLQDHPADVRVIALSRACADPAGARAALARVGAVFVGSTLRQDATHPWHLDCISRIPGVQMVVSAGAVDHAAALFRVDPV